MLSEENTIKDRSSSNLKEIMKVQSILLKAFYDYFEEQNFAHLLPVSVSRNTTPYDNKLVDEELILRYRGQNLRLTKTMVLHNQVTCGSGLENIFCQSSNIKVIPKYQMNSDRHSIEYNLIDFEMANTSIDEIIKFTEQLLRRVKVDIEHKCTVELDILGYSIIKWYENFPIYSRHDLEVNYGDRWEKLASVDHDAPFWVVCVDPHFYDKIDTKQPGTHYLNFNLYMPQGFGKVLSGSEREYRYDKLIISMKDLGFSRFDYSEYLMKASSNLLISSSGISIGIEQLLRFFTVQNSIRNVQLFDRTPGTEITF